MWWWWTTRHSVGDLRLALEWLRTSITATVALGLRDFDDAAAMREWWTDEVVQAVSELYDLAIIYGHGWADDPRVDALTQAGVPIHRTELIGSWEPPAELEDLPPGYLLVAVGGGVDGSSLLASVLEALGSGRFTHPTVLVTGSMMPAADVARLNRRAVGLPVRLERERADMTAVMAGARAIVAMAGYATVSEILASGKPALLVPRVHPRLEQLERARHWVAAGRVRMLDPRELDSGGLGDEIASLLTESPRPPQELTGAREASRILTLAMARS